MSINPYLYYPFCQNYFNTLFQVLPPPFSFDFPLKSEIQHNRQIECQTVHKQSTVVITSHTEDNIPQIFSSISHNSASIVNKTETKKIAFKKSNPRVKKTVKAVKIEQKAGRNSSSNFLRMFFRRLEFKVRYDPSVISEIIRKCQLTLNLEDFAGWFEVNKLDYRNYIRVSSVKKLFMNQHFGKEHSLVMRILLKEFIEREALPCYMTSKKAKKGASQTIHSLRAILAEILDQSA